MIGWIRHIEYLLLHNDHVAVPGLGCFSVVYHEARLLSDGHSFLPPTRTIAFKAGEGKENDLLVNSWMRACFISRNEALNDIAEGVATLRQELECTRRCELGRLGYLVDNKGTITFQSGHENALEYSRFGLAPLTITPLAEVEEESKNKVANEVEEQQWQRNPDRIYFSLPRRLVRAASVAAAIIIFLVMVSQPIDTPEVTHHAGVISTELFTHTEESADTTSNLENPLTVAEASLIDTETLQPQEQLPALEPQVIAPMQGDNYYIIVASLPNRDLAEQQIECFRQQGVTANLMIYETAGKARLYIASFDGIGDAQQYLAQLVKEQERFATAWIMKAEC